MFIRSPTAINDCLIALDNIKIIAKQEPLDSGIEETVGVIWIIFKDKSDFVFEYQSQEARDKAYDELCVFLNSNQGLEDFTRSKSRHHYFNSEKI